MKKSRLLWNVTMALLVFVTMFGGMKSTYAAETDTVNVVLHKRVFTDALPNPEVPNTGYEMDFGGEGLNGAEFTVYNVSDAFYAALTNGDTVEVAMNKARDAYTSDDAIETITTATVDGEVGIANFTNLDVKDTTDRYNVYVFVETKAPLTPTITKKAAPIVLVMPIYGLDTNGEDDFLETIHVYPKNLSANDSKVFVKDGQSYDDTKGHFNITTTDELDFRITLNVPADITDYETYTLTDTPNPAVGLAYLANSLTVKMDGATLDEDYYTLTSANGGFVIEFNIEDYGDALAGKTLVIEYQMKLGSEINPDLVFENGASVKVGNNLETKLTTITEPEEPNDPEEDPKFATGGFKFVKKDKHKDTPLAGVEFVIRETDSEDARYATFTENSKGEYVFAGWSDIAGTTVVSGTNGQINVIGFKDGEYFLEETKTLEGYVLLSERLSFNVTHGQYNNTERVLTVNNVLKGLLPATGGSGIYAFLAVGAAMMLGSLIWFKRSNRKELKA